MTRDSRLALVWIVKIHENRRGMAELSRIRSPLAAGITRLTVKNEPRGGSKGVPVEEKQRSGAGKKRSSPPTFPNRLPRVLNFTPTSPFAPSSRSSVQFANPAVAPRNEGGGTKERTIRERTKLEQEEREEERSRGDEVCKFSYIL